MEPLESPVSSHAQETFVEENRKAEDFITSGDLPAAAGILVSIIEKDPQNWRVYNNMGIISWMQRAWEDAYVMFKRCLTVKPDYEDAIMNYFDSALKLKKVHEALPIFKKALEINPDLEEAKILVEAIEMGDDEVYQSMRAMIVGVYNPLAEEGNRLLEEGKINEALTKFLELNDTQGPSAEAFSGLGVVSFYQERYNDAYTLFIESIKLNPTDSDTYLNLLDAAKICNKVDEAKKVFELCSKEVPSLKSLAPEFENAA